MNSFAAKRRARVVKTSDDNGTGEDSSVFSGTNAADEESPRPLLGFKPGRRPFRQSGLRKSFSPADQDGPGGGDNAAKDNADDDGPVVVRPSLSRSSSLKQKKKLTGSRLSFGVDAADPADGGNNEGSMPLKVRLSQKAMENSAVKRAVAIWGLPARPSHDDNDRPKYSKEYLDELQSSTPNTPRDISTLHMDGTDEMELDMSELEGALVVDAPVASSPTSTTRILSEIEIREKKERRARLAKEHGFLSVEEEDDDDDDEPGRRKKDDTRLVPEDEDLGEGFDDYVEDGGLSLGKRAEKERRKRERQHMAELITAAEGHTSDSSSDSDAERRISYEAAQTRAGMDGLKMPEKATAEDLQQVPPKITPLPNLTECLARLQATLEDMKADIKSKTARAEQMRREGEEVEKRQGELQALLDETGRKYQVAMGQGKDEGLGVNAAGPGAELAGVRGLESLGTTPRRSDEEDVDMA